MTSLLCASSLRVVCSHLAVKTLVYDWPATDVLSTADLVPAMPEGEYER